ncbi:MAG: hypothetical protein QG670_1183 [Thermoproteota archaeon]|nr:hypothetical protein [Thermoproteota archaeon]
MATLIVSSVVISRSAEVHLERFTDYFKGFERVDAVRELFGAQTEEVLDNLKIEFGSRRGYMGVSDDDGHLFVSVPYLKEGDERDIYLDVIHELVHVKQFRNGIHLRDNRYRYTNRPTEIEAYTHAVKEARRLSMSDKEIYEYLWMDNMSEDDVKALADAVNVRY